MTSMLAVAAAACTASGPDGKVRAEVPAETLLLGTERGPLVVRIPTGSVLFSGSDAVAGPDGERVYSTTLDGAFTLLETVDGSTGAATSSTRVRGTFDLGVVSGSGRAVALTEPLPAGWDAWTPMPRSTTEIVVADPTGQRASRRYVLDGNYEPEAFSTNDRRLFLIQHLPAEAPVAYRVTVLNLRKGAVGPVFGPFKAPSERMPGIRLQQALSPNGNQLYTLYSSAVPGYVPHHAPGPADAIVSFVHVLSLDEGWAHCVGLPKTMWDRPAAEQAMATSPGGANLFVIDAGRGVVAVMRTASLGVRTGDVDLEVTGPIERTSAEISADGALLYVATSGPEGSTVSVVETATFDVVGRWEIEATVTSLGLSGDGARLYAAGEDGLAVLDARTGVLIGETALDAPDEVVSLHAVAS